MGTMNDPQSRLAGQYAEKDASYYAQVRSDYIDLLPVSDSAAILELGCGAGATGAYALATHKCSDYVGIEMFETAASQAKSVLTAVHQGDVEKMELPYAPCHFDALICSEVLEHLVDPDAVVRSLAKLLKPGGLVFASSPCVSHWRNVKNLALGRWRYTDSGMMDRTHLRWFTPESFEQLFVEAGCTTISLQPLSKRGKTLLKLSMLPANGMGAMFFHQIDYHGVREPSLAGR